MKIERISIDKINPAKYNPRKDLKPGDKEYEKLKRSINEFDIVEPLVWNEKTGNLVGGHQRLKIIKNELGHKEVEVSVVSLDEKKEKALNIALNKISGEWDFKTLKELLVDLDDGEFDISLTGFDDLELKELIDYEGKKGLTDDDAVPDEPKEATTKTGDVWLLGDHRLMCGDSSKIEDVNKLMGDDKVSIVFTDPPYGVSIGKKNEFLNSFQKAGRNLNGIHDDDKSPEELKKSLLPAFEIAKNHVMADDCTFFMTAPQGGELGMMMMMMKEAGLPVRHVLIWKKNAPTFSMGRLDYDYQHEPILLTWGKRHKRPMLGMHRTSVWEINKPMSSKEHPTMKPVELYENAYLNNSDSGDLVYEPYSGSGTAFIASEKVGRKCRGMEISPIYCDVIVKRWEQFTGKKAELLKKEELAV